MYLLQYPPHSGEDLELGTRGMCFWAALRGRAPAAKGHLCVIVAALIVGSTVSIYVSYYTLYRLRY